MGRPKGSKNKDKTAFRDKIWAYCEERGIDPFKYMVNLLASPRTKQEIRFAAAKELAQYLEPKLRAVQLSGDRENPVVVQDATQRQMRIEELLAKRNGHDVQAAVNN